MTDFLSQLGTMAVSYLGGGMKGRPQWRDLEFMNDAQNRLWPDEIARQGDFLKGLAPAQGEAHNTFQDATYGADTDRQIGRISQMASQLGMSPWEITGAGGNTGATPLPAPEPSGGGGQMGSFLQGLVPLKVAQLQAKTQLATAQINAQTQRYTVDQQQGESPMAKAQIAATAALEALRKQSTAREQATTAQLKNDTFLSNVRVLLDALPTFSTEVPGIKMTGKSGTYPVLQALKTANTGDQLNNQQIWEAISKMDTDRVNQLIGEIEALAKTGAKVGSNILDTIMGKR